MAGTVDSHGISIIDNNVKEVKSIVKKLQKSGSFDGAMKKLISCNAVLLAMNVMILQMHM